MKILLALYVALAAAQESQNPSANKPPAIPVAIQTQYRASELRVQEAQAALKLARAESDLIVAQRSQMEAIKAVTAACGEFIPQLVGGELKCVPKPAETAAAPPRQQAKKEKP